MKRLLLSLLLLVPLVAQGTITFVGGAAAPQATGGSTANTVTINGSATTGDLLLITGVISGDNAGEAITTPTGFTLLESLTITGTSEHMTMYVWCKVHDGTETDPVLNSTGTGTGDTNFAEMQVYRSDAAGFSCATAGDIRNATAEQANAAAIDLPHPALNVGGVPNTLVFAFGAKRACEACDAPTLTTSGLTWTERVDEHGAAGDDWYMAYQENIQTTAANVASGSWDVTAGDESQISGAILLSLGEIGFGAVADPDFDSGPTLDACDADSCDLDYDANADADNIHCMALSTAEATPSAAAIEAHTGSNGHISEASTGAADTITVPLNVDSPVFPLYNFHCTAEEGTSNYSDVVSVLAAQMQAPADMAFWPILSVGAGSPCESFNTAVDPDIAANDWLLSDDATTPGSFALTVSNACQYSYPGDTTPQSVLDTAVYDASVGGWHADDIDVFFNNNDPVCDNEDVRTLLLFETVAMDAIDLDDFCVDPDVESLTYAVTTGSINSGLTLTAATGVIDGTPDTEDEAGNPFVVTASDAAGATDGLEFFFWVTDDEIVTPSVVGDPVALAIDEMGDVRPWLDTGEQLTATFVTSDTVPAGDIISQDPAAAATINASDPLEVVVSLGVLGEEKRRRFGFGFGVP